MIVSEPPNRTVLPSLADREKRIFVKSNPDLRWAADTRAMYFCSSIKKIADRDNDQLAVTSRT